MCSAENSPQQTLLNIRVIFDSHIYHLHTVCKNSLAECDSASRL